MSMRLLLNYNRRGRLDSVLNISIVFAISVTISLVDISNGNLFPFFHCVKQWIWDFEKNKNIGLSLVLLLNIAMLMFFFLFCLFINFLRFVGEMFLISKIGITLQFYLIQTRIGRFLHKHRLAYLINLNFCIDLIEDIFLFVVYIKCLIISLSNLYYNSKLYIVLSMKVLLVYIPVILFALKFIFVFKLIKMHSSCYVKSKKNVLILHESKLLLSTSTMPSNELFSSDWYVLDVCEYKQLKKKKVWIDILLLIVYIDNINQVELLMEKYKEYYAIPHTTSFLYCASSSSVQWDMINIDKNKFDYCKYSQLKMNEMRKIRVINEIGYVLENSSYMLVEEMLEIFPTEIVDYYFNLHIAPTYLYKFYRNILNVFTLRQAVNGFFDIIDLSLRLSVFIYSDNIEDKIIASMGKYYSMHELLKGSNSIDFSRKLNISFLDQDTYMFLCNKTWTYDSNQIDFDALLRIIEHLRNETKAHGFIKEVELTMMFRIMFVLSIYVFLVLDICSIKIYFDLNQEEIVLKFKDKKISSFSKYAFFDEQGDLFISTNRQGKYINMLTGEIKNKL